MQSEGCPEGRDKGQWAKAEQEVDRMDETTNGSGRVRTAISPALAPSP